MDELDKPSSLRLFLPLTSQAFDWYNLAKDVEVRKLRGRFKCALLRNYKFAELRKGYSGESKYASILKIIVFENSKLLFDEVDYKRIVPVADSRLAAEELIFNYVGTDPLLAIFLAHSQLAQNLSSDVVRR